MGEFEKLNCLIGKTVIKVLTELSTSIPINIAKTLSQIEIPIQISFEDYTLAIFNKWCVNDGITSFDDFIGMRLLGTHYSDRIFELTFSNSIKVTVNITDDGYMGPESFVLSGPNNLIVVWN